MLVTEHGIHGSKMSRCERRNLRHYAANKERHITLFWTIFYTTVDADFSFITRTSNTYIISYAQVKNIRLQLPHRLESSCTSILQKVVFVLSLLIAMWIIK